MYSSEYLLERFYFSTDERLPHGESLQSMFVLEQSTTHFPEMVYTDTKRDAVLVRLMSCDFNGGGKQIRPTHPR